MNVSVAQKNGGYQQDGNLTQRLLNPDQLFFSATDQAELAPKV